MTTFTEALNILNNPSYKVPDKIRRWRDVYYGVSLHICGAAPKFTVNGKEIKPPNYYGEEYQKLFDNFLMSRHPRESESTRNWRYSQYRPFTKAPLSTIIGIVSGTIFQDSNYSIVLSDKEDNEYIWGNNFNGYDIARFFDSLVAHIFEDPNGLIVRLPKEPYNRTTTKRIEPDIWFIPSKDILFADNNSVLFLANGYAWFIDRVAIFRFKKREDSRVKEWELADDGGYYAHMFGYLPVDVAGGEKNTQGHLDSWIDKAKAVADDFISSKSAEQLVDKEASHPFIIAANEECPTCNGAAKIQICTTCHKETDSCLCEESEAAYDLINCRKCGGQGRINRNPGEWLTADKEDMDKSLIQIVNPNIDINKHHLTKNKMLLEQMLESLHLLKVMEAQSGVAKTLDMSELLKFISRISNDIFDRVIFNTLRDIIAYRHVTAVNGVTRPAIYDFIIQKPTQFQIKTAMDLLSEYKEGTDANLPDVLQIQMVKDFADKQYAGDRVIVRKVEIITEIDPICTKSEDEKLTMVTSGAIEQKDIQFSAKLSSILSRILREKGEPWFMGAKIEDIEREANRIFDSLKPTTSVILQGDTEFS